MPDSAKISPLVWGVILAATAVAVSTWRFGSIFLLQFFISPFQFFSLPGMSHACYVGPVGVYPSMSISIADTDAGGNSQLPLAANGFSIVFIASALFKNDNSTIGSSLISNTRPPWMECPAI